MSERLPYPPLFVDDAELRRLLGLSQERWRKAVNVWSLDRTFPQKDKVTGLWLWPAVKAFVFKKHGLGDIVAEVEDGVEDWDFARK